MERLTNRELKALLAAVSVLHSEPYPSSLPARIFAALRQVISADGLGLDGFDPTVRAWKVGWLDPVGFTSPQEVEIFGRYFPEHPFAAEMRSNGLSTPLKISDLLTGREFQRTGIYNEFYRRMGARHQMALGMPISPSLSLRVALNRSGCDFTEGDRRVLTSLRPHMIVACRNADAFARAATAPPHIQGDLLDYARDLIILDAEGRVIFITNEARAIMTKYFPNSPRSANRLPDPISHWLARHASNSTLDCIAAPPMPPLIVEGADARLHVRLLPSGATNQQALLLEDEHYSLPVVPLMSLGLTKREAEILSRVADGKTNADIATLCDMNIRTVQKHLEHIYIKLGVETRTAAARRAMEHLGRMG